MDEFSQPSTIVTTPTVDITSVSIPPGSIVFGDDGLQEILISIVKTEPDTDIEVINLVDDSGSETETDDDLPLAQIPSFKRKQSVVDTPPAKRKCQYLSEDSNSDSEQDGNLDREPFTLEDVVVETPVKSDNPPPRSQTSR